MVVGGAKYAAEANPSGRTYDCSERSRKVAQGPGKMAPMSSRSLGPSQRRQCIHRAAYRSCSSTFLIVICRSV
jgi:hypothetical protein